MPKKKKSSHKLKVSSSGQSQEHTMCQRIFSFSSHKKNSFLMKFLDSARSIDPPWLWCIHEQSPGLVDSQSLVLLGLFLDLSYWSCQTVFHSCVKDLECLEYNNYLPL